MFKDPEVAGMFGYITSDISNMQRFSHVYSTESKVNKCSDRNIEV